MELANIKKTLEKYFEGNTSLEEEKALQKYFTQAHIPAELKAYQSLFQYFETNANERFNIDTLVLPITPKKSKLVVMRWFAAAASVVLLVGIYFQQSQPNYSKTEQMAAYMEYKKAMYLLSGEINKGVAQIAVIDTYEQTKNKIIKN